MNPVDGFSYAVHSYETRADDTANNGYAVGDEIDETSTVDGDGGRGYVTWANSTTVYHSRDGTGLQNTNADFAYPTTSHWRIVFYCW